MEPVCRELDRRGLDVAYLTASPDDPALQNPYAHVHAEFLGEGNKAFTKLNFLRANVLLSSTPGLDVYQWKRSRDVKWYTHVFHAEYECQDCKSARVSFMVMRKGLKFQIMGRSPIEIASLSKEMSSQLIGDERELFGDALMANKTGNELAAVCLLRVALERYLRRVTGNLKAEKMVSGDELYEQYKKRLPDDFCYNRVVPLGTVYNDLSGVMHSAEVPDGCFERNYANIELFFRFLSLMPLQN